MGEVVHHIDGTRITLARPSRSGSLNASFSSPRCIPLSIPLTQPLPKGLRAAALLPLWVRSL